MSNNNSNDGTITLQIRENIRATLERKVKDKILEIIDEAERRGGGLCSCKRTVQMEVQDPESGLDLLVKLRDSEKYNSLYMSVTESGGTVSDMVMASARGTRPRYLVSQYNTSTAQDLLTAVRLLKAVVRKMNE